MILEEEQQLIVRAYINQKMMSDRLTQLHLARPGPHEKSGLGQGELPEAQTLPYFGPTKHKTRT